MDLSRISADEVLHREVQRAAVQRADRPRGVVQGLGVAVVRPVLLHALALVEHRVRDEIHHGGVGQCGEAVAQARGARDLDVFHRRRLEQGGGVGHAAAYPVRGVATPGVGPVAG